MAALLHGRQGKGREQEQIGSSSKASINPSLPLEYASDSGNRRPSVDVSVDTACRSTEHNGDTEDSDSEAGGVTLDAWPVDETMLWEPDSLSISESFPLIEDPAPTPNSGMKIDRYAQIPPHMIASKPSGLIRPPPLQYTDKPQSIPVETYRRLEDLVHPPLLLKRYGYVTTSPTPGEIKAVLASYTGKETCMRCGVTFVYKELEPNKVSGKQCTHHPGRFSVLVEGMTLASGRPMKVWSCCHKRGFAPGCTSEDLHVVDCESPERLAYLCPFEATPQITPNTERKISVLSLDCEMSFTKHGLTLTRMSVLSFPDSRILVDTFIREAYPGVPIIDYNTRYSGVTVDNLYPQDPANSPPVLNGIAAARLKLWEYCDANTIIIGHGLDHDLKCLRLLHPRIIDTAILFSRQVGVKSRLKKLAEEELNWSIQPDSEENVGHDSVEDCRTCNGLVLKFLERPSLAGSAANDVPD